MGEKPKEKTAMSSSSFLSLFNFNPSLAGAIGIEREFFLLDASRQPLPRSPEFLDIVKDQQWTYELSACQVEHRTEPRINIDDIRQELQHGSAIGKQAAAKLGLQLGSLELAPANMDLGYYPHDQRYQKIVMTLPREILLAACRVAGVHIHLGVKEIREALLIHNRFVEHLDDLCRLGDHSGGERLRLYKQMAKNWQPPVYKSVEHLQAMAREQGFEQNPRNCWHLIRISRHGTVELRMFGMTDDLDEIIGWVRTIRRLAS
jgi:gamma-glutamyl:cysteine ligase YbdK (ATP-grasp superfamily)